VDIANGRDGEVFRWIDIFGRQIFKSLSFSVVFLFLLGY